MEKIARTIVFFLVVAAVAHAQSGPTIDSLSPSAGTSGATVTISGSGFGVSQGTSTVAFNGTNAAATSWSDGQVTVTVPAGASSGSVQITVAGQFSNPVAFTVVLPPQITSLSPASGPVGTSITIAGSNFGTTQGGSSVSFNGTLATPSSWSSSSIVVPVPNSATTGNVVVNVSVPGTNGTLASNGQAFTVAPHITSLSPTSGVVGVSVTISGSSFGATQGSSTVSFNGIATTPASWSATSIIAPVPNGATTGNVVVKVGGTNSNGVSFAVVPHITSLSLTSGAAGTSVTISGSGFGATQSSSTVAFNGVAATPSSWSASSIVVPVPSGSGNGNVVVTVGGLASNGVAFAVVPHITNLSPTSGVAGTSVTIGGSGFGATQGSSAVTFNGVAATPSSWSASSIVVPVPSGSGSGNVVVTVAGLASNGVVFAVVPHITSLSPTSAAAGTSVTISGSDFGATQGSSTVAFNGVAATPSSWSTSSIVVPVPSGGGSGNVVVTVNGLASNGVAFTVLLTPQITSLSPAAGTIGAPVTISGSNFGATQGSSTVTFNGVAATPSNWSASSIVVPVPSGASTGNIIVTVGGLASNGMLFSVAPQITGLSPVSGAVGSTVTVNGSNFGAAQGSSTVTFNGVAATPASWSASSIVVPVPSGTSTGNVVVTVGGLASNGAVFTLAPQIASLSTNSGAVGTSVTISGNNFGATQGSSTVTFNGVVAVPTSWSNTQIVVAVPDGATSGNVVVSVAMAGSSSVASNPVAFALPPVITGIVPGQGLEGAPIVINGKNFGAMQGGSTVNFNTPHPPEITDWQPNQIKATVADGATTGVVFLLVGGMRSNDWPFTVLQPHVVLTCNPACPGNLPYGTSVQFKVQVTNPDQSTPQGTVEFSDDTALKDLPNCSQVALDGNGVAPCPATNLNVIANGGGHSILALYTPAGLTTFKRANPVTWIVTPAATSLTVDSSANPSKTGQTVTFTATVTSANAPTPTGSVAFTDSVNGGAATSLDTKTLDGNGKAVLTPSAPLAPGTHIIIATYTSDNGNYLPSDNTKKPLTQQVNIAPVITSLTPPTGPAGMGFTIHGINFGAGPGTVTFAGSVLPVANGNWSDTAISVQVPANAAAGAAAVAVTPAAAAGQAAQSSDPMSFTVRSRFDACTP